MAEPRYVQPEPDITSWAPDACLSYAERFLAKARHHLDRGEVEPAVTLAERRLPSCGPSWSPRRSTTRRGGDCPVTHFQ